MLKLTTDRIRSYYSYTNSQSNLVTCAIQQCERIFQLNSLNYHSMICKLYGMWHRCPRSKYEYYVVIQCNHKNKYQIRIEMHALMKSTYFIVGFRSSGFKLSILNNLKK